MIGKGKQRLSIVLVLAGFAILFVVFQRNEGEKDKSLRMIEQYTGIPGVDLGDPLTAALFRETLRMYYPARPAHNDSVMEALEAFRIRQFTDPEHKAGAVDRLSPSQLLHLGWMYLQFILIYGLVLLCTYYGTQTLGLYRFIMFKQKRSSFVRRAIRALARPGKNPARRLGFAVFLLGIALLKGILFLALFSPAYVIAYSLKSTFDTDSVLFMIVLGVVSNGLLVTYGNKFFTLLVHESRKGYVETAVVKNLNATYGWRTATGVSLRALLAPRKAFPGHVLHHLFLNARYQYIPTMKEHASFLITGLIIIEMALNIQGHISYELLQQMLYRHYDVAILIMAGMFLLVKATEIIVDAWYDAESRRVGNVT